MEVLLEAIWNLIPQFTDFQPSNISRKCNNVVDCVAKRARTLRINESWSS